MTGPDLVLGFLAGSALGVAITAIRLVLARRLGAGRPAAQSAVPPSAEVLDAERRRRHSTRPLVNRRSR